MYYAKNSKLHTTIIVIIMTIVKYMIRFYTDNIFIEPVNCGAYNMIDYEPFWKTLKERGVSTYALINKYGISGATINRMKKGGGISTMKIDDLCRILDCRVEDVIRYVSEK